MALGPATLSRNRGRFQRVDLSSSLVTSADGVTGRSSKLLAALRQGGWSKGGGLRASSVARLPVCHSSLRLGEYDCMP